MNRNFVIILATGGGLGYSPKAPGTVGSILGVVLAYYYTGPWWLLIPLTLLGVIVSSKAEEYFEHDSPRIVIDEIIGMLIAGFWVDPALLPLAFLLFRLFDIAKPWLIGKAQSLPSGWGVMVDDILAGIFTRVLLIPFAFI